MSQRRSKYTFSHPSISHDTTNVRQVNNISTCLVQQSPPSSSTIDALTISSSPASFSITSPPPRALLIEQAQQWATKALEHANAIPSTNRNEECDTGCAVATHNLGEFLEMEGKVVEARRKYEDAKRLAKKLGFKEGVTNANSGLKRLDEFGKKDV